MSKNDMQAARSLADSTFPNEPALFFSNLIFVTKKLNSILALLSLIKYVKAACHWAWRGEMTNIGFSDHTFGIPIL